MLIILLLLLIGSSWAVENVEITEPIDGATYDGDWLTVRAIVENDNELPDSVHHTLNGEPVIQIPRLSTDWPTYMQNYQNHGYSESPAVVDNTILWTAPVTGDFHEFPTPVVVNGIVYYPSNYGTDSLYALNAATGEILWKYRTGHTDDAVTLADGWVYSASDSLYCLNAITGQLKWVFAEAVDAGGTPIVTNDWVFCAATKEGPGYADSTIVFRLDASTGEVQWSATISTGQPVSCMGLHDNKLIVPTFRYNSYAPLVALDIYTGEMIWENWDSYGGYWDSSPVLVDGVIYIAGCDGYIRGIDANTGETTWATQICTWAINPTLSHYDGFLYLPNACIETSLGGIVWQQPYYEHGSSGIAGGLLSFAEAVPDTASFITLNCSDGSEAWRYQLACGPGGLQSSPSIVDGVMYIAGTDWNLYAFGTGLKYTYLDDLFTQVGTNELIVTSFDEGLAIAADTINFTVTGTGINLEPSHLLGLCTSPNPFSTSLSISYNLPEVTPVRLSVYDLTGRLVENLVNGSISAGENISVWNPDPSLPAGCYLIVLHTCGERSARRCMKL